MPKLNDATSGMQGMIKSAQTMFAAAPMTGAQSTHFWQAQEQFLEKFEDFSTAWFKRRHDGTRAALEASRQLADGAMQNPRAAMGILTDWQAHSMERLAEDAKDCTEMLTHCAGAFVTNEVEAIEETVQTAKRAVKSSKSEPV